MSGHSIAHQARPWLVHVAIAILVLIVTLAFKIELPHWTRWFSVAIYALLGWVALANANSVPGMRPAFARAAGVMFLIIAVLGTIYQLSSD